MIYEDRPQRGVCSVILSQRLFSLENHNLNAFNNNIMATLMHNVMAKEHQVSVKSSLKLVLCANVSNASTLDGTSLLLCVTV